MSKFILELTRDCERAAKSLGHCMGLCLSADTHSKHLILYSWCLRLFPSTETT